MTQDSADQQYSGRYKAWVIFLLMVSYMLNFVDRTVLNTVGQAVKEDLLLTDFQLGLLGGAAFSIMNAVASIPIARFADRANRVAILSGAVALWSLLTAAGGLAQNVWQLALTRVGVGIAEAGGPGPSQSLISDYFPPERRASAFGVYVLGVPIGILLGAIGTGWVTQNLGWRAAFMAVGVPGILLALLMILTLKEPVRGGSDPTAPPTGATPTLWGVLNQLMRRRSAMHVLAGATILAFGNYGVWQFLHPFFVRSFDMSYVDAAVVFGLLSGISSGIGFGASGFIADYLAKRDQRYYLWTPAISLALATPLFVFSFLQTDRMLAIAALFLPGICIGMWFGPTFSVVHRLVDPRSRTTAAVLAAFGPNVLGLTLGPSVIGLLSDVFAGMNYAGDFSSVCVPGAAQTAECAAASAVGLRYALVVASFIYLWSALHYYLGSRTWRQDLANHGSETAPAVVVGH